ncbi:MAG TPA: SURF1 family protein [Gammaproteobacteria bacterium]|jgi:surfeit locus 1 family protein|nr:hypothetical protein [Chromatiales bacterium]MCP4924649.1 SURF1 family protein [Gammaproteobacteria bacterium]HJP38643.1 SURF1 family protein [Gammaproteobacteria bacterium]
MEELLKNKVFIRYFPYISGLFFLILFVSLGIWQLNRADEKTTLLEKFKVGEPYKELVKYDELNDFDKVKIFGQYLPEKQVLLKNIPHNNQFGYYVITPFKIAINDLTVLVNRGWIAKSKNPADLPHISIDGEFRTIKGYAGHLPRVAIRSAPAFSQSNGWPRVALYPSIPEIETEIQMPALSSILLLSSDAQHGFTRRWEPNVSGAMTHYNYAFQWFALALAVLCLVIWHSRRTSAARSMQIG